MQLDIFNSDLLKETTYKNSLINSENETSNGLITLVEREVAILSSQITTKAIEIAQTENDILQCTTELNEAQQNNKAAIEKKQKQMKHIN